MEIEEFKKYIRLISTQYPLLSMTFIPQVDINEIGERWHSTGRCVVKSMYFEEITIEGYAGKSLEEIDVAEETEKFTEMLHLELDDYLESLGSIRVTYETGPHKQ